MWTRSPTARASERAAPGGAGLTLDRRSFVLGVVAALAWPRTLLAQTPAPAPPASPPLPGELRRALETAPFVYVSPLRSDGSESTCHGEVWFAWLDGGVVITTARKTWKARALARGLDRARIWVGDYGRWKQALGRNEAFRAGPVFEARAREVEDPALLDRVLAVYEKKYPDEIGRWAPRMRRGHERGERVLIRYEPLLPPPTPPAGGSP